MSQSFPWLQQEEEDDDAEIARLEKLLGYNNGKTVFDYLAIISTLSDVIDQPCVVLSDNGEVEQVNPAFTEHPGLAISALQHGGWRQLFARDHQMDWDHAVAGHEVFSGDIAVHGASFHVAAKPIFNGDKFLGWRARVARKATV